MDRYEEVREISQKLYIAHKKAKSETGYLSEKQLKYFQWRLDVIGEVGKQYSRNRYDEYRYGEVRLIQQEMVEITAEPEPNLKHAKVKKLGEFASDDTIKPLLIALIDKAERKLDITSPWITMTEITDDLKGSATRGAGASD